MQASEQYEKPATGKTGAGLFYIPGYEPARPFSIYFDAAPSGCTALKFSKKSFVNAAKSFV